MNRRRMAIALAGLVSAPAFFLDRRILASAHAAKAQVPERGYGMTRMLDRRVHVYYSQAYVTSTAEELPLMDECFRGQQNGLCGASLPGFLFLTTGLHTGLVNMTIDAFATEPPLDNSWEEIVEVSFRVSAVRTG